MTQEAAFFTVFLYGFRMLFYFSKKETQMKKKTGCLGVIIIIILLFAVFLFWPVSDTNKAVILLDSFDNNDNGWDLQDSAKIENGELLIPRSSDAVIIPAGVSLKNGSITFDAVYKERDTGSVYGIMFRSTGKDDFDLFFIDGESNFFSRVNGIEDIADHDSYINSKGTNSLSIELYGKLVRISVNGHLVLEAFEKDANKGIFTFFSGGDSTVAFDNLKVIDFDKLPADIFGNVYYNNEKLSNAQVTAYRVVNNKPLETAVIDSTVTDENGEYRFYLPKDSSYFVESTVENGKISSDRYADLRIPDSGQNLDIHLKAGDK